MSIIATLSEAYERRGYGIQLGLNPAHFKSNRVVYFARLIKDGVVSSTGAGLSPPECQVIERLAGYWSPKKILVIGNAFGWSTLYVSLAFPNARVVALDNLTEGKDARLGFDLTQSILEDLGLNTKLIVGTSPEDVAALVEEHLGSVDFSLVDGLHTNAQQWKDYRAIKPCLSSNAVILFHDVLDWAMTDCFERIQDDWPGVSAILHRTPSGMGIIYTDTLQKSFEPLLTEFVERNLSDFVPVPIHDLSKKDSYRQGVGRRRGLLKRLRRSLKKGH